MKNIAYILIVLVVSTNYGYSTVQQPDMLLIKNDTTYIDVSYQHMSPLQNYFLKNKIEYPFEMLHTANYRGFVATWEITADKLYINKIQINREIHKPSEFIHKKDKSSKDEIFASWFTGFINARKYASYDSYEIDYEKYYYIKNGVVITSKQFTDTDYERIREEYETGKDLKNIAGSEILIQYAKYDSYFFGLPGAEKIYVSNQKRFISRADGGSLVLQYYNDEHLRWPYNWEHKHYSGAPIGNWKIIDDEIFLTQIEIDSNFELDKEEYCIVELDEIFNTGDHSVRANWLNGIYIIQHRKETNGIKVEEFEILSIKIIDVIKGKIVNQCYIEGGRDFDIINENTPENTKKLIKAYKNQMTNSSR